MTQPDRWDPERILERARERSLTRPLDPDQRTHEERLADRESYRRAVLEQEALPGIPLRYRAARATHPHVLAWIEEGLVDGTGLLLLGPSGVGKTWQAFGAYRQLLASGQLEAPAVVTTVADLLHHARPGNSDTDPIGEARTAPLLLLDDLGAQRDSDWTAEVLYRIIDWRWAWCRPTIITTNLPVADLRDSLGDRLASRIAGQCQSVALDGHDRRRKDHA